MDRIENMTRRDQQDFGPILPESWSSSKGFGLLDLFIVATFVAVIAAFSFQPVRQGIQAYRLDQAVNLTLAKLERARSLARSRGQFAEVVLDKDAGILIVAGESELVLSPGVSFQEVPGAPIRFSPRGYARGGSIVLTDDYGHSKTITITASGAMEVLDSYQTGETPDNGDEEEGDLDLDLGL